MSLKLQFAAISLVLAALQAPAYAAAPSEVQAHLQACYDEAQWPVTVSPAYVYGGARVREQQRNAYHPAVVAMTGLCHAMSQASTDKVALARDCGQTLARQLQVYGDKARDHAARTRDICQAMTGQPVSVAGI